jgi:hypothetical protein
MAAAELNMHANRGRFLDGHERNDHGAEQNQRDHHVAGKHPESVVAESAQDEDGQQQADDNPQLIHDSEEAGRPTALLGGDHIRYDPVEGASGQVEADLNHQVAGYQCRRRWGQAEHEEPNHVHGGAGGYPGPPTPPRRDRAIAEPADGHGHQERKHISGRVDAADQKVGVGTGDDERADGQERDRDRLPVGSSPEPIGIDGEQPLQRQAATCLRRCGRRDHRANRGFYRRTHLTREARRRIRRCRP